MTVSWKLHVQKSKIVNTRNIECVWHALCMAYCCDKEMLSCQWCQIVIIITVNTIQTLALLTKVAAMSVKFNKQGLPKRTQW